MLWEKAVPTKRGTYFPIQINFAAKIFELCLENKFKKANYFSLIACECEPLAIMWL